MKDVSSRFRDLNDWDRVYQTGSGYHAKIKTEQRRPTPDVVVLVVTGSLVDDQTGKALVEGAGHFIVKPHELTVMPDSQVDLPALLKEARELVARRVEQAAINRAALDALKHVRGPIAPPVTPGAES